MNLKEFYNSFLLKQFQDFYREVMHQRAFIGRTSENEAHTEKTDSHPIFAELLNMLESQAAEARRQGGEYGVSFYKDAQYVMAALADDIFLNMDWEGKETWKSNLLEFKLFNTYTAGEIFFYKIDKLLKARDPSYMEMAAVYFLAISLGFKGKYKGKPDRGELDAYRGQLFTFIFQKNPDVLDGTGNLFPQTYTSTIAKEEGDKLPHLKWWIFVTIGLLLFPLVLSHGIWVFNTYELNQILDSILNKLANMVR
ncbi:MAG: DotU family type IV/VI secretion system protein [Desulfobacteraceae bacterium]|nr:DotU family type IV/VI secretion system protein [Desulfobacteraceae bacterium]